MDQPISNRPAHSVPLAALRYLTTLALLAGMATARAAGLDTATDNVNEISDWVWIVVPILCGIAGAIVWLCYSGDLMRKDTAIQWGIGIFGAGVLVPAFIDIFF